MDIISRIERGEIKVKIIRPELMEVVDQIIDGTINKSHFKAMMQQNKTDTQELLRLARIGQRMQWVPVEKRLPKENEWVLGWSYSRFSLNMYICLHERSQFRDGKYGGVLPITHWMPLPELPKDDLDIRSLDDAEIYPPKREIFK